MDLRHESLSDLLISLNRMIELSPQGDKESLRTYVSEAEHTIQIIRDLSLQKSLRSSNWVLLFYTLSGFYGQGNPFSLRSTLRSYMSCVIITAYMFCGFITIRTVHLVIPSIPMWVLMLLTLLVPIAPLVIAFVLVKKAKLNTSNIPFSSCPYCEELLLGFRSAFPRKHLHGANVGPKCCPRCNLPWPRINIDKLNQHQLSTSLPNCSPASSRW